jgi:hypothetical protein
MKEHHGCYHRVTKIFLPHGPFFDLADSFSIWILLYVGQSGEQDAREKEMEENMNEVLDTFFTYNHGTTISEEEQAFLVLEIGSISPPTCWLISAKPLPSAQREERLEERKQRKGGGAKSKSSTTKIRTVSV